MSYANGGSLNVRDLTLRARRIRTMLGDGSFDMDEAEEEARQLLKEGEQWAVWEQRGERLVKEILSPVVVELVDILSMELIQHQLALLLAVARACCMFTEILWHQCLWRVKLDDKVVRYTWRRQPISILPETYMRTMRTVRHLKSILPENLAVELLVELNFVEEAIKWVAPVLHSGEPGSDLVDSSVADVKTSMSLRSQPACELFDMIKAMRKEHSKHLVQCFGKPTYLLLHEMRWAALQGITEQGFDTLIGSRGDECKKLGNVEGLTVVLMRIVEAENLHIHVRSRALEGSGETMGLLDILKEHKLDFRGSLVSMLPKAARQPVSYCMSALGSQPLDCFSKARLLIVHFLARLARDSRYYHFHDQCKDNLRSFQDWMKQNKAGQHELMEDQLSELYKKQYEALEDELESKLEECWPEQVGRGHLHRSQTLSGTMSAGLCESGAQDYWPQWGGEPVGNFTGWQPGQLGASQLVHNEAQGSGTRAAEQWQPVPQNFCHQKDGQLASQHPGHHTGLGQFGRSQTWSEARAARPKSPTAIHGQVCETLAMQVRFMQKSDKDVVFRDLVHSFEAQGREEEEFLEMMLFSLE